jgi:hypothetical protein
MSTSYALKSAIAGVLLLAVLLGWKIAQPALFISAKSIGASDLLSQEQSAKKEATKPPAWVPPTGNPVQRYQEGKTEAEREDMIGQFMALGHDENPNMLIAALKDESQKIRINAVEQVSNLEEAPGAEVLKEACVNADQDVRDMAWSLLAPYPTERRAPVLMASIERGSDKALEEAFEEMGRVPEAMLFEAMLDSGQKVTGPRQQRVLKELQLWLEPGGGDDVPKFTSMQQLALWWQSKKEAYDQWMLRVDQ